MTMQGMTYLELSRGYLEKGQGALQEGDYSQASEKLWSSAAEMVKEVAQRRGWQHNGHGLL